MFRAGIPHSEVDGIICDANLAGKVEENVLKLAMVVQESVKPDGVYADGVQPGGARSGGAGTGGAARNRRGERLKGGQQQYQLQHRRPN